MRDFFEEFGGLLFLILIGMGVISAYLHFAMEVI